MASPIKRGRIHTILDVRVFMRVSQRCVAVAAFVYWLLSAAVTKADDAAVATVVKNLSIPSAVAIRPGGSAESYEIFVADVGAGRIVKLVSNEPNATADAITEFESKVNPAEPFTSPGPQGLNFLDPMRLVVVGGSDDGRAFVRLYELREPEIILTASQHVQQLEPPQAADPSNLDVRVFHAIARTQANDQVADLLILTAQGDEGPAALWRIAVRANTLAELEVFDAKVPGDALAVPPGVTVGSHGYVVVSESAARSTNSRLRFCNPIDGMVALQLEVNLTNIVALAYSPKAGNLFAASFHSGNGKLGGIYRIDDVGKPAAPACRAVKVADVSRPTALAFGPDGALYVTAMGKTDDDKTDSGVLLKVSGDL